ncbi:uncharacterized protein BHQ10_004960 [Talaromyces amestolkiae]|uniref:Cutinase n=1 Tax=Talaromyces amestolkiae TaxID=1196081 RepID=A0A364KZH9_TALAM|nr:uncharacterized protein BHQ10_004960 [Talaromyces amestolkiae]RAO68948.1 hypothetical protein BHQ10_004960 [Talaromyces amestolkiae]
MLPTTILLLLPVLQLALAAPVVDLESRQAPCDSVHIFLARGTDEPYPGRQSSLVEAICFGLPSCGYEDIVYPAVYSPYCNSVSTGVSDGTYQVAAYASRCPGSKLVLSGYSQGAQIVGDILGGGGGTFFNNCTEPTTSGIGPGTFPGNQIAAALLFGDVRHVPYQPYNTGTGAGANGIYPRTDAQLFSLNRFSNILRSWCLATDPVCARGLDGNSHTTYFDLFSEEAGAWVKSKL